MGYTLLASFPVPHKETCALHTGEKKVGPSTHCLRMRQIARDCSTIRIFLLYFMGVASPGRDWIVKLVPLLSLLRSSVLLTLSLKDGQRSVIRERVGRIGYNNRCGSHR